MNLILLWPADWVDRHCVDDTSQSCDVVDEDTDGAQIATPTATMDDSRGGTALIIGEVMLMDERRVTHIRTVIKAVTGDTLKVGEVDGLIGTGVIQSIKHHYCTLSVRLSVVPPTPSPVTLVLALPEPTVFVQVLHQATVLGVKAIYIIDTAAVQTSWWGAHVLQREAIETTLTLGLEQTIDTRLPRVHLRRDTLRFITNELPPLVESARALMLARQPGTVVAIDDCTTTSEPVTLLVGPARNFTKAEESRFKELGFRDVSFGRRALHITAAVHALIGRFSL